MMTYERFPVSASQIEEFIQGIEQDVVFSGEFHTYQEAVRYAKDNGLRLPQLHEILFLRAKSQSFRDRIKGMRLWIAGAQRVAPMAKTPSFRGSRGVVDNFWVGEILDGVFFRPRETPRKEPLFMPATDEDCERVRLALELT